MDLAVIGNVMNKRYVKIEDLHRYIYAEEELANTSRKALIAANERSPTRKEQKLYSSKTYDE